MEEFIKKGFPHIKFYEDHFEVKAIDSKKFRAFKYSEITKISYGNGSSKLWFWPFAKAMQDRYQPYRLKIYKTNKGDWVYPTTKQHDKDFAKAIGFLRQKCKLMTG